MDRVEREEIINLRQIRRLGTENVTFNRRKGKFQVADSIPLTCVSFASTEFSE